MSWREKFVHQKVEDLSLFLTPESDNIFASQSGDTPVPALAGAASAPVGGDSGPHPSRLLAVHIGVAIRLPVQERCCGIKDRPC